VSGWSWKRARRYARDTTSSGHQRASSSLSNSLFFVSSAMGLKCRPAPTNCRFHSPTEVKAELGIAKLQVDLVSSDLVTSSLLTHTAFAPYQSPPRPSPVRSLPIVPVAAGMNPIYPPPVVVLKPRTLGAPSSQLVEYLRGTDSTTSGSRDALSPLPVSLQDPRFGVIGNRHVTPDARKPPDSLQHACETQYSS